MTKSEFSIIIPALNEQELLPRLLDNLASQTLSGLQIIVVDANSSDDTVKVAKKYSSLLNLKLISTSIRNVSYQRNLGAKHAQADWIMFFDADNQISTTFFQKLTHQLTQKPTDFFTTFIAPDSDNSKDQFICSLWNLSALATASVNQPHAFGACIGVKKSVFIQSTGFDKSVKYQEDQEFVERLKELGFKFSLFPKPQLIYSFRRFRKEGRLKLIRKTAHLHFRNLFDGFDSRKDPTLYPMLGGAFYQESSSTKTTPTVKQLNQTLESLTRSQLAKLENFIKIITSDKHS